MYSTCERQSFFFNILLFSNLSINVIARILQELCSVPSAAFPVYWKVEALGMDILRCLRNKFTKFFYFLYL